MFYYIRHVSKRLFSPKYLLATNIVTGGTLMALGDAIEQTRERRVHRLKKIAVYDDSVTSMKQNGMSQEWDWKRTGTMFTIGVMLGPLNHYWYKFLDRALPGVTGRTVLKKVILDELIACPIFTTAFFMGVGILEGKNLAEGFELLKKKFLTVYMLDLCVYPPVQAVNFFFIPSSYRVIYINTFTLLWNIFLSFMAFSHS